MDQTWLAGGVFLLIYGIIVSERIHRSLAALAGGAAMIILGILPQEQAFHAVDWNVIFLLASMMVMANVLRETGAFQWLALQAVRLGKGKPMAVLSLLALVTAITSAFLDNVTIVILMAPVTLFVASSMQVNPVPFLIAEILASNIGGMSTLVGDPPNIMIGSATGIDFVTFLANMGPISLIILLAFLLLIRVMFKNELGKSQANMANLSQLDARALITKPALMRKAIVVMAAVVIGFLLQLNLHLEPATIALIGAVSLILWGRLDPEDIFGDIEWTTLMFFIGLFITVEAIVHVGIIESLAQAALELTGGNVSLTSMLLIWLSALVSGFVDNIPYTATMIPLVESMGLVMSPEPLWWSLAAGACLGGNLTLVGAAANVVVANIAQKSGHPISFGLFLRYGFITTFVSLSLASLYVWLRYL